MVYVIWNYDMQKMLLEIFVECYNKGDKCQNGWKSHAYTNAMKMSMTSVAQKLQKTHQYNDDFSWWYPFFSLAVHNELAPLV